MIRVTEKARARLREILTGTSDFFIIEVISGGCSGLRYEFSTGAASDPEKFILYPDEGNIAVDAVSASFLEGAILDWDNSLMGSKPVIRNPLAVSGCGCGISFSVE